MIQQSQIDAAYQLLRELLQFQLSGGTDEAFRDELLARAEAIEGLYPEADWTAEARIAWILALLPQLVPGLLDNLLLGPIQREGDFPQLGGVKGKQYRGYLATVQTVIFFLGGGEDQWRQDAQRLFASDHFFAEQRLLQAGEVPEGEPRSSGLLIPDAEVVETLLSDKTPRPHFSTQFPAERISTKMTWEDLVLNDRTNYQVEELLSWLDHGATLLNEWGMSKRIKAGYRVLFHGPPGTGKTLTATLVGQKKERDVYRVDLSMVVSKYIGETEKNLAALFTKAEHKDWILFFDEADALFGKRTGVKDAHDRYANQEVSYLLQRIETYDGLIILASNFKSNIDEAFMRRFQSVIHFPIPTASERLRLWTAAWPEQVSLGPKVKLEQLAQDYELSGATINNVVQKVCLRLLDQGEFIANKQLIVSALRQEMAKEGKII
ncbi:MAG: ATP-binding protein [Bacteroidota bacterium]